MSDTPAPTPRRAPVGAWSPLRAAADGFIRDADDEIIFPMPEPAAANRNGDVLPETVAQGLPPHTNSSADVRASAILGFDPSSPAVVDNTTGTVMSLRDYGTVSSETVLRVAGVATPDELRRVRDELHAERNSEAVGGRITSITGDGTSEQVSTVFDQGPVDGSAESSAGALLGAEAHGCITRAVIREGWQLAAQSGHERLQATLWPQALQGFLGAQEPAGFQGPIGVRGPIGLQGSSGVQMSQSLAYTRMLDEVDASVTWLDGILSDLARRRELASDILRTALWPAYAVVHSDAWEFIFVRQVANRRDQVLRVTIRKCSVGVYIVREFCGACCERGVDNGIVFRMLIAAYCKYADESPRSEDVCRIQVSAVFADDRDVDVPIRLSDFWLRCSDYDPQTSQYEYTFTHNRICRDVSLHVRVTAPGPRTLPDPRETFPEFRRRISLSYLDLPQIRRTAPVSGAVVDDRFASESLSLRAFLDASPFDVFFDWGLTQDVAFRTLQQACTTPPSLSVTLAVALMAIKMRETVLSQSVLYSLSESTPARGDTVSDDSRVASQHEMCERLWHFADTRFGYESASSTVIPRSASEFLNFSTFNTRVMANEIKRVWALGFVPKRTFTLSANDTPRLAYFVNTVWRNARSSRAQYLREALRRGSESRTPGGSIGGVLLPSRTERARVPVLATGVRKMFLDK